MKRIVVLGGGESGCGAAVLAKVKGFDVLLSDGGKIADKYKALLGQWEVPFEEGGHTAERIVDADEVIKSPGIPDKAEIVRAVRSAGIPVISEIEFAGRYTDAKTICITGSNGKTTTTTLTYRILKDAGFNVGLAGNIGESFALSVATQKYDWYVIELSSFQLDGMYRFRADVGVLMNITPDHLDRYDYQLQNYVNSKFRILQNQREADTFIYCTDDPLTMSNLGLHQLPMRILPFTAKKSTAQGGSFVGGAVTVNVGSVNMTVPAERLKLRGVHNMYNVMAASMAAITAGVPVESIVRTLESFGGVEHRLEPVREVDGIKYVNDSKATNVDSVWYALDSMTGPTVWIAGGTDKGNDYSVLYDLVKDKVKALVCMGVDNAKLIKAFEGRVPLVMDTHSLGEAMSAARDAAAPGDTVLLSPACASFDLFKNYEDRGRQFKEWVNKL